MHASPNLFGLASETASWLGVVGLLNFAGMGEIIKQGGSLVLGT